MKCKKKYSDANKSNIMLHANVCCLSISILFLFLFFPLLNYAQQEQDYDETLVLLSVDKIGGGDIPAAIRGMELFLPVSDLFDFLGIYNKSSYSLDTISGFFLNQDARYLIDAVNNKIKFKGKSISLDPGDIIKTPAALYLKSNYFGSVFGLVCTFNFRSLSVVLKPTMELPAIRQMRLEKMRENKQQLKGELEADTTYHRTNPFFHFGMADWSVISTQQYNGRSDNRLYLALGSVIAGGEADVALNYNAGEAFTERQQYYLWKYVNNDFSPLRQAMAGKIYTHSTSSIYAPVLGVQLTNTPSVYRRSFGTYNLSDYTEPGWTVELYVNNVLVDFVKADARGFFTFKVPLVYGNSNVKLRFYGPWGEEKSKEQNISVPFNFLPPGQAEYTLSGGLVEDKLNGRFGRANLNYGMAKWITMGAGVEYLSTVSSGATMPFADVSMRLASSLLLSGEYTYGVRAKGVLSYRLPSNLQIELNYVNYTKGQTAINYNYKEERKAIISMPVRTKNFVAFMRLTLDQIILPISNYTSGEFLISGAFRNVSTNFTTYAFFTNPSNPYIYSSLSLAFRLPLRLVISPRIQYEYINPKIVSAKCEVEKRIFKAGYMNLSYEQNFKSQITNIQIGLRYDLRFGQAAFSSRTYNNTQYFAESARGSLIYDQKAKYIGATEQTSVGRGGIIIEPFLDINCNGKRDDGEPAVSKIDFKTNGGRVERDEKDTTIRILNLQPYTQYLLELDPNSLDNIAWQLKMKTIRIDVEPNQLHHVQVAVAVYGEVSGMVYLKSRNSSKGQGRIIVNIYSEDSNRLAQTLTEPDGYFFYLGLAPGSYFARIDSAQLRKLDMEATPNEWPFVIHKMYDGDIVDDPEFVLHSILKDTIKPSVEPPLEKSEIETPAGEKTEIQITAPKKKTETEVQAKILPSGKYSVQVGAFDTEESANLVRDKLAKDTERPVMVFPEDGYYKVRITGYATFREAARDIPLMEEKGYSGAFVAKLKK